MTEWQQLAETLAATREASEARWHLLNRKQEVPMGTDEPTTVGVLIDNPEAPLEEGPEQDFEEIIEETRWSLFNAHRDRTAHPLGDDTGYVPPSHRWLPLVREAAAKLAEAEAMALTEIPKAIYRELVKIDYQGGGGLEDQVFGREPEVRRLKLMVTAVGFIRGLAQELLDEGRPRRPRNLTLAAHRRSEDDQERRVSSHSLADLVPGRESRRGFSG